MSAVGRIWHLADPKIFDASTDSTLLVTVGWQFPLGEPKEVGRQARLAIPRSKGFAPTVTTLISGESKLVVNIHFVSAETGTSSMLAQRSVDTGQVINQMHI